MNDTSQKELKQSQTASGDKEKLRTTVGEMSVSLRDLFASLTELGDIPDIDFDRNIYLLKRCLLLEKSINKIIDMCLRLNDQCAPRQAGGRPPNKHLFDAYCLLYAHFKSTGELLTARELTEAINVKFYNKKNNPDANGKEPLPERLATKIIKEYKDLYREIL
jgi:hypothetical protein